MATLIAITTAAVAALTRPPANGIIAVLIG